MSKTLKEIIRAASTLPTEQKWALADQLWREIEQDADFPPPTTTQLAELDRRMKAYLKAPSTGVTWEETKAKLRKLKARA
jgi:putative addiction module component (TIGR02574 family)